MMARARLVSVNLASEGLVRFRGHSVRTGIFKEPTAGRVRLATLGLDGDFQADLAVHGGPEKAAYAYPSEHYPYFRDLLGRQDLPYGFFGENFTTEGLLEDEVHAGDVLRIGTAVVRVTTPRSPCFKLGAKAGSPAFVATFLRSRRLGFYLSVVKEGEVGAGDAIQRVSGDAGNPTIARVIEERYFLDDTE
jgi:MOSC domain-containing protein YiiM